MKKRSMMLSVGVILSAILSTNGAALAESPRVTGNLGMSLQSIQVKPTGCKVSRTGRVTCKSDSTGPRVWNNGKSRGYYWP